ncbi:unnamed protein product [Penicillium egyptiacum]|uniref:LysM domain-containing protein n=1 Tax=Penicillium egyptiacum TaxID=1303716 RepID=A0A9W4KBE4_9EURO|nr:unnamed protein product [Penicillium egyptiacum]
MYTKSTIALALLPGLLEAHSIGNPIVRRGVDCSFATAANPGDTCDDFADTWGISVDQFKSLNPGLDCGIFDDSQEYCVLGGVTEDDDSATTSKIVESTTSVTTSASTTSTTSTTTMITTTTTSANSHEPTQPGLAKNCDGFLKIVDGDNCDDIIAKAGISHQQFSEWNPYINDKCSNLWLDYYVCVHVPGTTTTPPVSKPTDDGHSPTQSGIAKNCDKYHRVVANDQCDSIETSNSITHAQFREWNPAIDAKCSNLLHDYYVCVHVPGAPTADGPTPQMPDIVSNCKRYHKVNNEGCYDIEQSAGISHAQFRKWNPTVDASCSNLWAGYYVCIGV